MRAALVRALAGWSNPIAGLAGASALQGDQPGSHLNRAGAGTDLRDWPVPDFGAAIPSGAAAASGMQRTIPPFMQNPIHGAVLPYSRFDMNPDTDEWGIASTARPDELTSGAPGTPQEAPASIGPAPASANPPRAPGAAVSSGRQASQSGASGDKSERSEEELAKETDLQKVCRFTLARPWKRNKYAFSAEEILSRYKRGGRPGVPFPSPDEAVKAALGRWQNDEDEYLAIILRFTEGPYKNQFTWSCLQRGYKYTEKQSRELRGAEKGVDVPGNVKRLARTEGTEVYGWAHTHGRSRNSRQLERIPGPSPCDKTVTAKIGIKGYLLRNGQVDEIEPSIHKECIRTDKTGQTGTTGAASARAGEHCSRHSRPRSAVPPDGSPRPGG